MSGADESFLWKAGMTLMDMRLIAEGACVLYENDAGTAVRAARQNQQHGAADSMDTIGAALYRLRDQICELQSAQTQAVLRELEE